VLLSGGLDSATALYLTKSKVDVRAITFVYHGIAQNELDSAKALGSRAGLMEHRLVRLPDLMEAGDMTGFKLRGLPPSYIPMRNSIFYSFAASYAEETGADLIVGGHHRDDRKVFDDVSPEFFGTLEAAFRVGSPVLRRNRVSISLPLSKMSKVEVVGLGASLGVPFELTWSCHRDRRKHCWRCQGCATRKTAFQSAGVEDPLMR